MQAMLLLAIFSLLISLGSSIIINTTNSTAQLTAQLRTETENYFKNIGRVINSEITPNNLRAAAASRTDAVAFIQDTPTLAQMAVGRWGDASLDAWGNTIQGAMVREYVVIYNGGTDSVQVPVTGFVFVSAGPNREFETTLPANPTLASLQGVVAPTGSDDIVVMFNDESAQRENFSRINTYLARISTAIMRRYQADIVDYQEQLMAQYLQQVQAGISTTIPSIEAIWQTDPNAPKFIDISIPTNRVSLGVDDDFYQLEHTLPSGGSFIVTSTLNADNSLTLRLSNNPTHPTSWGRPASSLSYSITLKGGV